jgi:hypothetical protein
MKISDVLKASCLLLGCTVALMPSVTVAQSIGGGDQRDPFNRASNGDTSGLMQLINQSQLNGRNDPNYLNTQRDQLDSATEAFRDRQAQAYRDRQKKNNNPAPTVRPESTPAVGGVK